MKFLSSIQQPKLVFTRTVKTCHMNHKNDTTTFIEKYIKVEISFGSFIEGLKEKFLDLVGYLLVPAVAAA